MRKSRMTSLAGVAAALLLATTACGSQEKPADTKLVQPAAGDASAEAGDGSGTADDKTQSAGQLAVRSDSELGSLVTDSEGMTLYRFDEDTADPAKSNCDDECAEAWPPVPADDVSASAGLNPEMMGSVTRSDGTEQLTLGGWPQYRFAKDTEPGDTKGQNVKGTWFASAPDGKKAGTARPALGVLNSPELGEVLTDKNGKTLYLFTKDTPWPMKTACDAECLKKWKPSAPVSAADAKAAGLDPAALFTFTTPNGTKQEAINCWPAYTFTGDKEPGETNGQGVGGVWFAIKKDVTADRGKTVPAAKAKAGEGAEASDESGAGAESGSDYGKNTSGGYDY